MPAGRVWEVVTSKGALVRVARELASPALDDRLSSGTLVQEVELVGDRLRYNRIAGAGDGPESGWISIRAGGVDLLRPADDREPPEGGWKVLERELPSSQPRPVFSIPSLAKAGAGSAEPGPGAVAGPQCAQVPGRPFIFCRKIQTLDTKPTGLRMSSCFAAMDECRTDHATICDHTVESLRKVTQPFTQVSMELRPAILKLAKSVAQEGLLVTHKDSKGLGGSWFRVEARFGWPKFPFRNEEQSIYLAGKELDIDLNEQLATGRFTQCLCDDSVTPIVALSGESWQKDADKFFARTKRFHSFEALNEELFNRFYPESQTLFVPTKFKRVSWLMSHCFGDLWNQLYHAKTPELLWDLNKLAGGSFAELVKDEPDPQAVVVSLPSIMEVGKVFDAYCFLEESKKRSVYVLLPSGRTSISDHVLAVFANYDWKGAPADGKTLTAENVQVLRGAPLGQMLRFVNSDGKDVAKPGKNLDLSKLALPSA